MTKDKLTVDGEYICVRSLLLNEGLHSRWLPNSCSTLRFRYSIPAYVCLF